MTDLMELLQGSGVEDIMMPRADFIKEHKRLIGVLRRGKPEELKHEAADQSAELQQQLKGGRGPSLWITALKEWNAKSPGTWCVPRKGTSANDEVREIFARLKGAQPPKEAKVRKGRQSKAAKEAEEKAAKEAAEKDAEEEAVRTMAAKVAARRAAKKEEEMKKVREYTQGVRERVAEKKEKQERKIAKYMEEWKAIQDYADEFTDKKEWNKSTFKDKYVGAIYKSKHPEQFKGWKEFAEARPDIARIMAQTEYPDHIRKYYNQTMAKTSAEKLR